MICPTCQAQVQDGSPFCPRCGTGDLLAPYRRSFVTHHRDGCTWEHPHHRRQRTEDWTRAPIWWGGRPPKGYALRDEFPPEDVGPMRRPVAEIMTAQVPEGLA